MTTNPSPGLPPVAAEVAAGALDLLPARLRKRVDGALAKAAAWPVEATPDGVRVRVDDDTAVTLKVTDGIVAHAADAACDCLLAPACLHRAAVLSLTPLAETAPLTEDALPGQEAAPAEDAAASADAPPGQEPAPAVHAATARAQAPSEHAATAQAQTLSEHAEGTGAGTGAGSGTVRMPNARTTVAGTPPAAHLTPAQTTALRALHSATTAVLVSGVTGGGAVQRAELLHAAHSARLAGLHLPSAAAVRIARRLGEARSEDPAFRLSELSAELAGLLDLVRRPADAVTPARRAYEPAKPLRLYGLFTEPVVTASGYAGATTYAVAPDGTLRTVSDVAPGGPERAAQAAGSPVPGGCALPLREWGDGGGVILTNPTVSPDGRIGGGSRVRSVRATGAQWHEPPLDALWQQPPAAQLAAALDRLAQPADTRPAGSDLLFLTGTISDGGFAVTEGPALRLLAPDERPELPYAENLRLLGVRPGLALRLIARAVPDRPGGVHALAAAWTGHDGETVRADLGLRRLNRSHIPAQTAAAPAQAAAIPARATATSGQAPAPSVGDRPLPAAPPALPLELDLLRRAVDRTVAGGRAVTAASADGELPRRLRAVGLTTGAECARALAEAAADRRHDALGRLLPADPDAFAAAWLATAVYSSAAARSLLLAAWSAPGTNRSAPPRV
ncbi:hypothetical protein ACQEVG_06305 [Streptomyces sp. CA-135486]|uniref:hypothetical protein n=1 Tax=Streptomyces sp. CA-135486 TaxID=3240049 RepID=UPI003D9173B4